MQHNTMDIERPTTPDDRTNSNSSSAEKVSCHINKNSSLGNKAGDNENGSIHNHNSNNSTYCSTRYTSNDGWSNMNRFHDQIQGRYHQSLVQSAALSEYGHTYGYMPPLSHKLPSESLGHRSSALLPPLYSLSSSSQQQQQLHHSPAPVQLANQPLQEQHSQTQPLQTWQQPTSTSTTLPNMSSGSSWSSLIASRGHNKPTTSCAAPNLSLSRRRMRRSSGPGITINPRKLLNDDIRRHMCEYAFNNPQVKQVDIGAKFGVERSTVSKVLRNREKYFPGHEWSHYPPKSFRARRQKNEKREKSRSSFASQEHGTSDALLTESDAEQRALVSASSTYENLLDAPQTNPSTSRNQSQGNDGSIIYDESPSWMDKFKWKSGGISPARPSRRVSEPSIPDSYSMRKDGSSTGNSIDDGMNYTHGLSSEYQSQSPSQVNPSAAFSISTITDTSATSSLPSTSYSGPGILSPTSGHYAFSQDVSNSAGYLISHERLLLPEHPLGGSASHQRPRRQTFPSLDIESTPEAASPDSRNITITTSSVLQSQGTIAGPSQIDIGSHKHQHHSHNHGHSYDSSFDREQDQHQKYHRHAHISSQVPRSIRDSKPAPCQSVSVYASSLASPAVVTAVLPCSTSPSEDDVRHAADTLLSFFHHLPNGFVEQDEYPFIIRLMDKLTMLQAQFAKATSSQQSLGGLARIPEGDADTSPTQPPPPMKIESMMRA